MKLKNVLFLALIALTVVGVATGAGAAENPFIAAATKLIDVFYGVRTVVYTVGAFVLIGMAWGAFTGRIKWTSVGVMAIGFAILALAGTIITYATSSGTINDPNAAYTPQDLW